jgi:hypothetical protein
MGTGILPTCCAAWRLNGRTSVGDGYQVYSDGSWLCLSRGGENPEAYPGLQRLLCFGHLMDTGLQRSRLRGALYRKSLY